MKSCITFILFFLFIPALLFPQDKIELKRSDKLTGRTEDGKSVREATGNVYIVHGRVQAYCNTAVQYLDENRIELRGDVKILQDTLSLYTSKAIYYGNDSRAFCEGGVTLKDPNATVRADGGVYFFGEAKAVFKGNVIIINPAYRITSDELTYLRGTEDSFARSNVVVTTDSAVIKAENIDFFKRSGKTFAWNKVSIQSDSSTIYSDTLTDYSFEKKSIASGNVIILNSTNRIVITGNYAENYEREKYSFIKGNSKLEQVTDLSEGEKDTLLIYSSILETYRTKPERYIAKEKVEIIRGTFLAKSDTAVFAKTTDDNAEQVSLFFKAIVWQDNLQLTGDSIYAGITGRKLSYVYSKKNDALSGSVNSFLLVENENTVFPDRFDQMTGRDIKIVFENDTIKFVNIIKNSQSIYFLYEEKKGNGVNVADGENMLVSFGENQKVSKIRIDKNPKGQYIPETQITSVQLTLPGFNPRKDKPVRK